MAALHTEIIKKASFLSLIKTSAAMSSCIARKLSPSSTSTAATPVSRTGPRREQYAIARTPFALVASKPADRLQFVAPSLDLMSMRNLTASARAAWEPFPSSVLMLVMFH